MVTLRLGVQSSGDYWAIEQGGPLYEAVMQAAVVGEGPEPEIVMLGDILRAYRIPGRGLSASTGDTNPAYWLSASGGRVPIGPRSKVGRYRVTVRADPRLAARVEPEAFEVVGAPSP